MIILDLPNWMLYVTWFITANIGLVIALLMWLWFFNKLEMRKDKKWENLG